MRKSALEFLAAWDEFWFEVRHTIRIDVQRLLSKLKPIKDVDDPKKIYRKVILDNDHDDAVKQWPCVFCGYDKGDITRACIKGKEECEDEYMLFCSHCGYQFIAEGCKDYD